MKKLAALGLLVLAMVFTNCNETRKVVEDPDSVQLMATYNVTELNDTRISKDKGISFEISGLDKSIKGVTACNSFSGEYTLNGSTLRIIEINISENYCDDSIMKSEQSLIRAFKATGSYMIKEQILTF